MKIRTGFVSNSSSSSYVIAVTEDTHKEILSKLHEFKAYLAGRRFTKKKLFGKDMMLCFAHLSSEDGPDDIDDSYSGEFLDWNGSPVKVFYNERWGTYEPVKSGAGLLTEMDAISAYMEMLSSGDYPEDSYISLSEGY